MNLCAFVIALLLSACSSPPADGPADLPDGADTQVPSDVADPEVADTEVADTEVIDTDVIDSAEVAVLSADPGLGAHLVAISLAAGAPAPVSFSIHVTADELAFELADGPSLYTIPSPADGTPKSSASTPPFMLIPGERRTLTPARLLLWSPTLTDASIALDVRGDTATAFAADLHLAAGTPTLVELTHGPLTLTIATRSGAPALDPETRIGLTLDGSLVAADLADRVAGPIAIKHYAGARRWLLRPACDSDEACAEGGPSYPCATHCACVCDSPSDCDCDFAALESTMQTEALATARRLLGLPLDSPDTALSRARIHWVFKRSLGGSGNCAASGELDVTPATYAVFFARSSQAALAINTRLGFRLIDVLSPMNEANHPLQDGAHVNAAGQPTVGGFASFVDLIAQSSCNADGCCQSDRYIVPDPDVPALAAAALAAANTALRDADPALAPHPALSLYLDTEQRDPLQTAADETHPSIVTPVSSFMATFAARVAALDLPPSDLGDLIDLIVVDTYPGSWGAPWFETPDGIVHHLDPATHRIVRVDPVAAADAAIARAMTAADDVASIVGRRPRVLLGEVGWSTFDGDEAAQATFARRLFDAAAATQSADPAFIGMLWFKSHDRVAMSYPTWISAPNPLDPDTDVACETRLLGPIVCAAALLQQMDGQWGLIRTDGTRKPAWEAFISRWSRAIAAPD